MPTFLCTVMSVTFPSRLCLNPTDESLTVESVQKNCSTMNHSLPETFRSLRHIFIILKCLKYLECKSSMINLLSNISHWPSKGLEIKDMTFQKEKRLIQSVPPTRTSLVLDHKWNNFFTCRGGFLGRPSFCNTFALKTSL
jgi:hypothetical protein